ncbi:cytochrome bd-I oxidase subunit CydX [uncultured Roseibium sp.]|uniref:cytochrome bd-I oxidase subunit CydX n=1 Tax=uncultured Roseibium sp. TaxID=1936171 RepID=UPI003216804C
MWYFTWILGLFAAAIFAVVNAMWLELQQDNRLFARRRASADENRAGGPADG